MEINAMDIDDGWTKITAVVDSGAGDNVLPKDAIPFVQVTPTARSKAGRGFCGPSGESIKNYGQKKVEVKTAEGQSRGTTWQVADVRRPLDEGEAGHEQLRRNGKEQLPVAKDRVVDPAEHPEQPVGVHAAHVPRAMPDPAVLSDDLGAREGVRRERPGLLPAYAGLTLVPARSRGVLRPEQHALRQPRGRR